jgi:toxin ParE1/3/4
MKVNWTAAARAQLRDIHTFIARSSPQYAKKIVDRLTRRSLQIATFPRSGRVVPEANDVNIREVLEGSYRIIYHLLDDEVDIIAVVHSARPWPENP